MGRLGDLPLLQRPGRHQLFTGIAFDALDLIPVQIDGVDAQVLPHGVEDLFVQGSADVRAEIPQGGARKGILVAAEVLEADIADPSKSWVRSAGDCAIRMPCCLSALI